MTGRPENVRALIRGLKVLKYLNTVGEARTAEISKALSIPRPTVYRLLRTLEDEGYVLFSSTDARARVSALAAGLGDNSASRSRLCQAAGPVLVGFTNAYSWPVDLSVYDDAHMVVQETTHGRSPLSVDRKMAGYALPMLHSSAGRAYLANCEEGERQIILDLLRQERQPLDLPYLGQQWQAETLAGYRAQGFATRGPDTFNRKTSSIGIPIMLDGRVVGCLSIIWVSKAMSLETAVGRYLAPLNEAAASISQNLANLVEQE